MNMEEKKRKAIDLSIDDIAALQILATRQGLPLKIVMENFLHQLAEVTIRQELEQRVKNLVTKKT
ncbi:MAG: hypothetical protein LBJ32_03985 [Oscillospiraceae bacterium]|nr:hypothetical protein [Oscillospiraceae bacterium]